MMDEDERRYDQPSGSRDVPPLHTGLEPAQGSLARILAESQPKSAVSETSPLLPRASSRSRIKRRRASISRGDVTVGQAILLVRHRLPFYNKDVCLPFFRSS